MAYEIVVTGLGERTLHLALEHVAADLRTGDDAEVTVSLPDQAALVGAINALHSLGSRIEHVSRTS